MHREKWRLALGLLDTLAEWQLEAPVVVADVGYGVSTPFRLGLQERGLFLEQNLAASRLRLSEAELTELDTA